jgi:ABC-type glycerol-3-phosphate transport system substrate-binding protein
MKKSIITKMTIVSLLVVSIIAVYGLSGCAAAQEAVETVTEAIEEPAPETAPAEEPAEVTAAPATISLLHDKGGNPNYQPYFEEMGSITQELFNITIEPVPYPTTDVFIATVKAALPTADAPELFTWWSTYRMKELIDQGLLAPTTDLWEKHKDDYSQGLRDAFTFDGEAYGFSYTQEFWPVWYNKDVFAEFGLSEPETWAEFEEICDTLLANGVTPMAQTVQARWPTFIMFEEMIIGQDPQLYVDLCEGRVKYSDPKVKEAFEVWASLIAKGYFTDAAVDYFVDAPAMFNADELGMILAGTWYYQAVLIESGVPDEKIGAFILPSHNTSAGKNIVLEMSPIAVSSNAADIDAAMKAVDYFMSPEGNEVFARLNKSYPSNTKSSTDFLPDIKVKIANTVINENYNILNRYWEATPTPICEEAVDKFAEFILNPAQLDRVLADLDQIADSYWAQN